MSKPEIEKDTIEILCEECLEYFETEVPENSMDEIPAYCDKCLSTIVVNER